jgi:ribulose-phosphate 3-epimerase
MEISISVEPFLAGDKAVLRKYLDDIVSLSKSLPLSVHFDFFEYKKDILAFVGGYADKIAVHLHSMVDNADELVADCRLYNFVSVSIHADKTQYIVFPTDITITKYGIVVDLDVGVEQYANVIKHAAYATVMTVQSGGSGRPFDAAALSKVGEIRKINPNIKIIVDGGVNNVTIAAVKKTGADIAVIGSYAKKCYEAGDLEGGIRNLL